MPPNGQTRIEGTEVPLVTDGPVPAPKPKKEQLQPQAETLFNTGLDQPANGRSEHVQTTRPLRGRLAMQADVNAGKRVVETEMAERAAQDPEPTEQERAFGAEQARKLAAGDYTVDDSETKAA